MAKTELELEAWRSWELINDELHYEGGVNADAYIKGYIAAANKYKGNNPLDPKHYKQEQVYPENSIKD